MYIVKLTFNYDWPLFRQTPNYTGVWGNYKFVIDDDLKECDFWIIYCDYKLKDETIKCNPNNIIFVPGEGTHTSPYFYQYFLDQFGAIITVQKQLKHRNLIYTHNANPWFVGKSYDELSSMQISQKTKLISIISSNKAFTEGHVNRLKFVNEIKSHFGDKIDVFGRGIKDFDDKWDVLANYKYSIAIENDYCEDWVTEKFIDCLLAYTYPIYYGCPNLEKYFPSDSFQRIDINDIEGSIKIIESLIDTDVYESKLQQIAIARDIALNKENLFPFLVNIINNFNPDLEKVWNKFKTNESFKPTPTFIDKVRIQIAYLKIAVKKYLKKLVKK
jgi:hypothetical protein